MLQIIIPSAELWDEEKNEFINTKEQVLQLEHSLVSLSRWESKWNKAFLSQQDKTLEETLDYIQCMTLTPNVKQEVYDYLTSANMDEIKAYIEAPMTATTFSSLEKKTQSREQYTAELIYYSMISYGIPFECQKWHLNRLITLIRVCDKKNQKPTPMSKRELMNRNSALNAARRKQLGTKG